MSKYHFYKFKVIDTGTYIYAWTSSLETAQELLDLKGIKAVLVKAA